MNNIYSFDEIEFFREFVGEMDAKEAQFPLQMAPCRSVWTGFKSSFIS